MGVVASVPSEIDFSADPSTKFALTKPHLSFPSWDDNEGPVNGGIKRKKTASHGEREKLPRKRFKNSEILIIIHADGEGDANKKPSTPVKQIFRAESEPTLFELDDRKKWVTYVKKDSLRCDKSRPRPISEETQFLSETPVESSEKIIFDASDNSLSDSSVEEQKSNTDPYILTRSVEVASCFKTSVTTSYNTKNLESASSELEDSSEISKGSEIEERNGAEVNMGEVNINPGIEEEEIISLMSSLNVKGLSESLSQVHSVHGKTGNSNSLSTLPVNPPVTEKCTRMSSAIPRKIFSQGKMRRREASDRIPAGPSGSDRCYLFRVKGSDCLLVQREADTKQDERSESRLKEPLPNGHPLRRTTLEEFKRLNRKKILAEGGK